MSTGFAYDPTYLAHNTGPHHPESAERLIHTLAYLEKQAVFKSLKKIKPRTAEQKWIQTIHAEKYLDRAREACAQNERMLDTPDVRISTETYRAALLAAGAALELCDHVMAKKIKNGFALVRPPGHHAEKDFAMGFCVFNNAAITARYLQKKHSLERILILDWDAHHGNGTQHTFEEDPSVLYVSLHQYPFYPGTGSAWESGEGKGAGLTLNCPMKAGAVDSDYERAFTEKIIPKVSEFKPDAIIISAGFDAHTNDPLAQINLSSDAFRWMSERTMELAEKFSSGRIISLLEGGYDLSALPECVTKHLEVLSLKK